METFNAGKEDSGTEVLEGNEGGKIGIPYRQWIYKKRVLQSTLEEIGTK